MRVKGDAEQCLAAATALGRAAFAVAQIAGQLRQAQLLPTWSGTAQERWAALALRQAVAGEEVSRRLRVAAAALVEHAQALAELQARAVRLVQEADEAGLHLDDDGRIPRPRVELGPTTTPEQELLRQWLLRRQEEARVDLLARVERLRADETHVHERLRRSLRTLEAAPDLPIPLLVAGPAGPWAPTWWDAPSLGLGVASGGASALPASALTPGALGAARGPVLVLRNVPVVGVVSTGYGAYVDTQVNGMGTGEAVLKNVTLSAIGTGVTYGVTAAGAAVSAPVTVVVVLGLGTGAVVSYGIGRVWDAISDRRPLDPRLVPRPAPGPSPQPPSAVHSRGSAPSPAAPFPAPSG